MSVTTGVNFLGLHFDTLDMAETERWLAARGADSPFAYVITPNVDHMVRLADAPADVVAAYRGAALTLCDSRVLARIGAFMGIELPIVPGSDLVERLFGHVLKPGDRICLIGGSEGDAARLRSLYPELDILHHDAPYGLRTNAAARSDAARFAIAAEARMTFLAVGSPQQELIAHEMALGGASRGTALCIGAAVEFIIGTQRRAPVVVQRAGMEWAWRLARDPRRLAHRYLVKGPAIFAMAWRWRNRSARP